MFTAITSNVNRIHKCMYTQSTVAMWPIKYMCYVILCKRAQILLLLYIVYIRTFLSYKTHVSYLVYASTIFYIHPMHNYVLLYNTEYVSNIFF